MYLFIGFLSGAMLVHNNFIDTHSPIVMKIVSLCDMDGDIHQTYLSIILFWTLKHVVHSTLDSSYDVSLGTIVFSLQGFHHVPPWALL